MRILILSLLFISSLDTFAETFEQRFNRVCSNYNYNKNDYNKDRRKNILELIKKLRTVIWDTAELYNISPIAIAGSIVAEHSMNTNFTDSFQNFLSKNGVSKGSILGYKYTYGIGQLHFERAAAAETWSAVYHKRSRRTDAQINDSVNSYEGSIDYIGALIVQEISVYKRYGFDISKDDGVLTTLYNIGKVESRAKRSQNENRLPEPNYFGCYVEAFKNEIVNAVGPKPIKVVQQEVADTETIDVAVVKNKPKTKNAKITTINQNKSNINTGAFEVTPRTQSKQKEVIDVYNLNKSIKVSQGPKGCYDDPQFLTDELQFREGTSLTITERKVDCNFDTWVVVTDNEGKKGWILKSNLESNSKKETIDKNKCEYKYNQTCKEQVLNENADYLVADQGKKLIISSDAFGINKNPVKELDKLIKSKLTYEENFNQSISKLHTLSKDEINTLTQAYLKYEDSIVKKYNLNNIYPNNNYANIQVQNYSDNYDKIVNSENKYYVNLSENPYKNQTDLIRNQLLNCLDKIKNGSNCVGDSESIIKFMNAPLSSAPTADELSKSLNLEYLITSQENMNITKNEVSNLFNWAQKCKVILNDMPGSLNLLGKLVSYYYDAIVFKNPTTREFNDPDNGSKFFTKRNNYTFNNLNTDVIEKECEFIASIKQTNNDKNKNEQCQNCTINYFDPASEGSVGLSNTFSELVKILNDANSRDDYFIKQVKSKLGLLYGSVNSNIEQPWTGYNTRDLIDKLKNTNCIRSFSVGKPEYATDVKTVYVSSKNPEDLVINFETRVCK